MSNGKGGFTQSEIARSVPFDNTIEGNLTATNVQDALDELSNTAPIGTANHLAYYNPSGDLSTVTGYTIDAVTGALETTLIIEPDNNGGDILENKSISIEPLQNSPNESWNINNTSVDIDPDSSGFTFGTSGTALKLQFNEFSHQGTSNTGELNFTWNNFNLGNGTDPITIKGLSYAFGLGQVNANVTLNGPIQGYGFQPSFDASSTLLNAVNVFYDYANCATSVPGWTDIQFSPNIAEIENNTNYNGMIINPTIPVFTGNAGYNGISFAGTLGTLDTGSVQLINVSTTIDDTPSFTVMNVGGNVTTTVDQMSGIYVNQTATNVQQVYNGIYSNTQNITGYPGVQSSLVFQDLTFTFIEPGSFNDSYTMEYTSGGTAGSEVVSIVGFAIEVQIESGVSTANQIKTALEANAGFNSNVTTTVSGVGGNTQVTAGPTNFSGGDNAANIYAGYFDGDVTITGDLTFGGALSVGKFDAFASQALVDGGGTPTSVHSLVSQPTVANGVTIANADMLGVNTASLITIGTSATVTTAFLGIAALGLPAVLSLGAGSTVDKISGAVFALSLDSAGAGTVDQVALCRALAIPNAGTTVNRLYGYEMGTPFGAVGTDAWGIYISPSIDNWMAGSLRIGGTTISDDKVTNASTALEIGSTTKAFLNARMTTTQRDALTALNGMQIYNTTTDKLQAYAAGVWVDLH